MFVYATYKFVCTVSTVQGVCHKYWPESGVMKVGEYLIDSLQAEELTGFVIRSFSVVPEKVDSTILY